MTLNALLHHKNLHVQNCYCSSDKTLLWSSKRKYLLNEKISVALIANVKQKSVSTSFLGENCLYFSAHQFANLLIYFLEFCSFTFLSQHKSVKILKILQALILLLFSKIKKKKELLNFIVRKLIYSLSYSLSFCTILCGRANVHE